MKKIAALFLSTLALNSFASLEEAADIIPAKTVVREIKKIKELEAFVPDNKTRLILAVDNVLLTSSLQMATKNWFYYRIDKHRKEGMTQEQAANKAVREWTAVLNLTRQTLVDPDIVPVLNRLYAKNVEVLALSSRGIGLASNTVDQLKELGVNLNPQAIADVAFALGEKLLLFRGGVLFTSGALKVAALKKFSAVKKLGSPQRVVMLSQSDNALRLMAEGFRIHSPQTEFVALRLTTMDKLVAAFDAAKGDREFTPLEQISKKHAADKVTLHKHSVKPCVRVEI